MAKIVIRVPDEVADAIRRVLDDREGWIGIKWSRPDEGTSGWLSQPEHIEVLDEK